MKKPCICSDCGNEEGSPHSEHCLHHPGIVAGNWWPAEEAMSKLCHHLNQPDKCYPCELLRRQAQATTPTEPTGAQADGLLTSESAYKLIGDVDALLAENKSLRAQLEAARGESKRTTDACAKYEVQLEQKMQEHQDALSEMRGRMEGASHALRSYQYGNCSPDLAADMADSIDAALGNIRGDGARISGIEGIHGVNTKARHCQSCAELERRIRTLEAELVTARAVERHWLEFEEARQRELRAAPPSAGAV